MTTVDVLYRYGIAPAEFAMIALNNLREVYGIRRIDFSEAEKTVRIEYDATRLNEPTIRGLLARTGSTSSRPSRLAAAAHAGRDRRSRSCSGRRGRCQGRRPPRQSNLPTCHPERSEGEVSHSSGTLLRTCCVFPQ